MKCLIVVISIHHDNTVNLGKSIAQVLDAKIASPKDVDPKEIDKYDLVGFGSGIYSATVHKELLGLVENISKLSNAKAFIFSTAGITSESKTRKDHQKLQEKLEEKGCTVIGNFQCKGFNTNSFLKFFGGMNKGRPNAKDLRNAQIFAQDVVKKYSKKA